MLKKSCRLCGYELFNKPLLTLNGMPKAAQHFLDKNDIADDKGIDLDIFQCSSCGLVQLNIEPVGYYKEVITAASISGDARKSRLNQMLELGVASSSQNIKDFNNQELTKRNIILGQHCFGCTAGAGSSCQGSIA